MSSVDSLADTYLDFIEIALKKAVEHSESFKDTRLYEMMAYHMGWLGSSKAPQRGKRVRPLLVLLVCTAAGGDWNLAQPGAIAVELIHNFSLIHDDIEDHSRLRRGRATVWKKWGIPQAINTGDAMFALAHLEASRLASTVSPTVGLKAVEILQWTCLHLTQGQFLDLSYESRTDLTVEDYWPMVEGKTAALISACSEIGALAGLCDSQATNHYREFGRLLGLAFQVQDDYLGIWGNASLTGKSSQSDLVTRKITLPVIYGLSRAGKFARRWNSGPIANQDIPEVIDLLEADGAVEFTKSHASRLLQDALKELKSAEPNEPAAEALESLATSMVDRRS